MNAVDPISPGTNPIRETWNPFLRDLYPSRMPSDYTKPYLWPSDHRLSDDR
ncbi:hypothetical protein CHCC14431_3510 [Bacillus licheniformis]|nr:hypothetical protein CHCC14431_3510 [Bacillus licheniformis]